MSRFLPPVVAIACALLGAAHAADPQPVEPFDGKDFKGWKFREEKNSRWQVGVAAVTEKNELGVRRETGSEVKQMVNERGGTDISTDARFGDVTVELEFMIPKGSNSGVYLMGEYEVQILDSFGKADADLKPGDCGGIYTTAAPKTNACKKPGEWQKFVIEFRAPKFEGEKKTANARFVKVTFNDAVIHENVEVKGSTGGGLTGKEHAAGPLMFQGDHGPVAFRNIKITPKK
jgi:hypothetical protein